MLIEKSAKKIPIHLKIGEITADFQWCFQPEGNSINGKAVYKELLKNTFKFDPLLHGFEKKAHSNPSKN